MNLRLHPRLWNNKNILEFNFDTVISLKDFRLEIISYLKKKFNNNQEFIKIVNSSVFCSEENEIISDNYKITKEQKIGIIPPIGGGWCFTLKLLILIKKKF